MNVDQIPERLADSGVDFEIQDPGNGKTFSCKKHGGIVELVIGAGSETRTLANPVKAGLELTIAVKTAGGGTATVSGVFLEGSTSRTSGAFDTSVKYAFLKSMNIGGTLKWVIVVKTATFS